MTKFCSKKGRPQGAAKGTEHGNLEEKSDENRNQRRESEDDSHDEADDARLASISKPGRGRPKIIWTEKPGRPTKRKHQVPAAETQREKATTTKVENRKTVSLNNLGSITAE